MDEVQDAEDLAKAIAGMTYANLVQVATELWEMTQEGDGPQLWNLKEKHQWAEMLSAWAESKAD